MSLAMEEGRQQGVYIQRLQDSSCSYTEHDGGVKAYSDIPDYAE